MGGANYQTPTPVTRTDGSQIIWDWNTRDFVPYTPPTVDAQAERDRQRRSTGSADYRDLTDLDWNPGAPLTPEAPRGRATPSPRRTTADLYPSLLTRSDRR